MADPASEELLRRVRLVDDAAAGDVVDRYLLRLIGLASANMSQRLKTCVDPEDVVQSAFRSFFVHAREGEYVLRRAGDLWRLLAAITLNKIRRQAAHHTAQRRDMSRDVSLSENASSAAIQPDRPSPDEAAALFDEFRQVMQSLTDVEREVLQRRLCGETVCDIAGRVDRSQRTVRRVLEQVRHRLEKRLAAS